MKSKQSSFETTRSAIQCFEKIKQGLQGIDEVLNLTYPENHILRLMAQDNIRAVYGSFLRLMTNEHGTKELIDKIKSAELDLDISIGNIL